MKKIAVFVEGQTELIFVREMLLKCYAYQNVRIECYTLFSDGKFNSTDYSFPNKDAAVYYQIINIGNDKKVLSSMLNREEYMFSANQAFDKIIGLRDMYSKEYREATNGTGIDLSVNQKFIETYQKTIEERAQHPDRISFHFAIMETEAWFLAMDDLPARLDDQLTVAEIQRKLDINLSKIDPETTVYKPAELLHSIFALAGKSYTKKKAEVDTLLGNIKKEDFDRLNVNDKCAAFTDFYAALEINN